jgi:hypothetical protein
MDLLDEEPWDSCSVMSWTDELNEIPADFKVVLNGDPPREYAVHLQVLSAASKIFFKLYLGLEAGKEVEELYTLSETLAANEENRHFEVILQDCSVLRIGSKFDTVFQLKQKIANKYCISAERLVLFTCAENKEECILNREMVDDMAEDWRLVSSYTQNGSCISLIVRDNWIKTSLKDKVVILTLPTPCLCTDFERVLDFMYSQHVQGIPSQKSCDPAPRSALSMLFLATRLCINPLAEQLASLLQQSISPLDAPALIGPAAALGLNKVRAYAEELATGTLALAPRGAFDGLPLPSFERVLRAATGVTAEVRASTVASFLGARDASGQLDHESFHRLAGLLPVVPGPVEGMGAALAGELAENARGRAGEAADGGDVGASGGCASGRAETVGAADSEGDSQRAAGAAESGPLCAVDGGAMSVEDALALLRAAVRFGDGRLEGACVARLAARFQELRAEQLAGLPLAAVVALLSRCRRGPARLRASRPLPLLSELEHPLSEPTIQNPPPRPPAPPSPARAALARPRRPRPPTPPSPARAALARPRRPRPPAPPSPARPQRRPLRGARGPGLRRGPRLRLRPRGLRVRPAPAPGHPGRRPSASDGGQRGGGGWAVGVRAVRVVLGPRAGGRGARGGGGRVVQGLSGGYAAQARRRGSGGGRRRRAGLDGGRGGPGAAAAQRGGGGRRRGRWRRRRRRRGGRGGARWGGLGQVEERCGGAVAPSGGGGRGCRRDNRAGVGGAGAAGRGVPGHGGEGCAREGAGRLGRWVGGGWVGVGWVGLHLRMATTASDSDGPPAPGRRSRLRSTASPPNHQRGVTAPGLGLGPVAFSLQASPCGCPSRSESCGAARRPCGGGRGCSAEPARCRPCRRRGPRPSLPRHAS